MYRSVVHKLLHPRRACKLLLPIKNNDAIGSGAAGSMNYTDDASDKNNVSDLPKKARKTLNKAEKAKIDLFGAWDTNEVPELLMEASIKHGAPIPKITHSDIGCSSIIGQRTYQEDRYFVKEFPDNLLCCAVFDGHGGAHCSEFCYQNIETVLQSHLESEDLETVLHNTIMKLNGLYKDWVLENNKGEKSGTTCTIILLKGINLTIGHIGDSRVLLCRRGEPRRLTNDHCPSSALEKKRIEQAGGTVSMDNIGRHMVNGALNMSRSIGDLHLKPVGVISVPDTRTYQIKHGKDSFLMLSTDGVTHVLTDTEICNLINVSANSREAAESVTDQAITMSSQDNATAIVIPLGSWGESSKSASSMFYSFGIGRNMTKSSRFG